jgi:hypothetical protein|tara:strand:+ start:161 stop:595 length:435 start_codon:yes stop_codon:yes gene_type:complete
MTKLEKLEFDRDVAFEDYTEAAFAWDAAYTAAYQAELGKDKPEVALTCDIEPCEECEEYGEDCDCDDDVVNQPTHYARWVIEPITYIMRNGFEFWRGNIVKYASRAGFKIYAGKTKEESEIIDLEKVIRYSEMRINQINGEGVL